MSSGNKFARTAGRGQFRPPPNRGLVPLRHGQTSNKKTLLGKDKNATALASVGNGGMANVSREESFQLMPHPSTTGPPFAMVIRLQPEILEELKQAEADGIQPEMKFGTNASGHVIQVGFKTFKFSSAPEPGHLCDIYEQRNGECGEAVLSEAGSAWRKLSVQRILSASEKDRVKKRTAEAEKKQRQRKSILVDPSTQMIIPQASTGDVNGRKPLHKLSKEPPPKKRKVTMSPIKQNTHSSSMVATGIHQFSSPASPSLEPPAIYSRGSLMNQSVDMALKGRPVAAEKIVPPLPNKAPAALHKEKTRTLGASAALEGTKSGLATNMTDLRNFLIVLMQDHPKGVTIKAIEKAVAEGLPSVPDKKVLDKVMKSIASFHAPGKYLLNAGVEKGNFLDSVPPPTSSGRAQEAVRSSIHEDEPSNSIFEIEAAKEKEPASSERGLSTHNLEHSIKELSPELIGSQPFDSNTLDANASKQDTKDSSTGGSESTSSSGSDSDSESSGSGSESGSESGSDSASGSSSGASIDEDVDIMSDDDAEKKSDSKQKPKSRELKAVAAEEGVKMQENNNLKEEGYESIVLQNRSEVITTSSEQGKEGEGQDVRANASENIINSVFGPDEMSDSPHENVAEQVRGEQTSYLTISKENYGDRKTSLKTQNCKESRERNTLNEVQRSATRDSEALELKEDLDLLVGKVTEFKEPDSNSLVDNTRVGFASSAYQQEHFKPLVKSVGLGPAKVSDKRRADAEHAGRSKKDRRERDVYDGRRPSKNLAPGPGMIRMLPEESPVDLGDHMQNVAKTAPFENVPQKQQASAEPRRATSKKHNIREFEKFDEAKALEDIVKGRSPSNMAKAPHRTATPSGGDAKLDSERGVFADRTCDKGGAETSDLSEAKPRRDRGAKERILDGAKFGDFSAKQSRDFEAKHWQQKEGSALLGINRLNVHHASKEPSYTGSGHDRDSPRGDRSSKVLKLSRHEGESVERAGLAVEQAERPLPDIDSSKRAKDINGKGILKGEPDGRLSTGKEPIALLNKEPAQYGDSRHSTFSHGRSQARETSKIGSHVELQDPPACENGYFEPRRWTSHIEESRGKTTSGTSTRVLHKGSSSPDQDDIPAVDRGPLDLSKQSPDKVATGSRQYTYDLKSEKRRPEDIESAEAERLKKRANAAARMKQPAQEEWYSVGPVKKSTAEKGRFSASDSQGYASVQSEEDMEELFRQQKVSQPLASSSEHRRETFKAGNSFENTKRETSLSNDEICDFFAPYEKKKPELRGLINTFQEYKDYCKEYYEKYPIYIQLNHAIEKHKKLFESFRKDIERAKFTADEKKVSHTCEKVKKEFSSNHKKWKRMFHTFRILHEELQAIKTRCKDYAEKEGQRLVKREPL